MPTGHRAYPTLIRALRQLRGTSTEAIFELSISCVLREEEVASKSPYPLEREGREWYRQDTQSGCAVFEILDKSSFDYVGTEIAEGDHGRY